MEGEKMKFLSLRLTVLWCLLPIPLIAGDLDAKPSVSIASVPNSRDTDLRVLLRDVGTRTHKHFVLDPRTPQSIDLGGLDQKDVTYPQLLSILEINGMVVIADGGIMQVLPNTDARQAALPLIAPGSITTLDDEWITSVIPVKNISAAQLVPILRPMIPQQGHLAAFPDRNALIIVDRSANVKRLAEVIRILENLPKAVDSSPSKAP
jgi:general secretion pathway protein D